MTEREPSERHEDSAYQSDSSISTTALDAGILPQMQVESERAPEFDELLQRIEGHLGADETVPQKLLTQYADLWRTTFQPDRPVLSLAWPAGWYIPTAADWKGYWIGAPPAANRYRWQFAASDRGVARADIKDGSLFAYAADLPGVRASDCYALVGATHVSPYRLAYATLSARITGVAEHHLLMQLPPAVHGSASVKGWAYLVLWQRNPVDGSWELKHPFATVELFSATGDQSGGGQQTVAGVVPRHTFDYDSGPFSVPVLLEAGREYVVGVEVRVRTNVNVLDGSNRPYNIDRAGGDVWFCWGDVIVTVPQIHVDVTKVLVP